ncbi:MAG: hypothetical protein F6K23_34300 [Okeania sp. SIO2C9]|uniref:hypothetical protein n=1 Tax=Okeania sp. SIO2C9 TaxID=2607791 RepID=UPI0013C02146|nr:hypothetical protein [Okeania sp. SIO2C9]NEQ77643.1 hypothetical protein [Okeania sp. SIO2C9]
MSEFSSNFHFLLENFIKQWEEVEEAAKSIGCLDKLHIWPDPELKGYVAAEKLNHWLYMPTIEKWQEETVSYKRKKH